MQFIFRNLETLRLCWALQAAVRAQPFLWAEPGFCKTDSSHKSPLSHSLFIGACCVRSRPVTVRYLLAVLPRTRPLHARSANITFNGCNIPPTGPTAVLLSAPPCASTWVVSNYFAKNTDIRVEDYFLRTVAGIKLRAEGSTFQACDSRCQLPALGGPPVPTRCAHWAPYARCNRGKGTLCPCVSLRRLREASPRASHNQLRLPVNGRRRALTNNPFGLCVSPGTFYGRGSPPAGRPVGRG